MVEGLVGFVGDRSSLICIIRSGTNPNWRAFVLIAVWRFMAMPAVAISTVYWLRKHNVMKSDPILVRYHYQRRPTHRP